MAKKLTAAEAFELFKKVLSKTAGIHPDDCGYDESNMAGLTSPKLVKEEVAHIVEKYGLTEVGQDY